MLFIAVFVNLALEAIKTAFSTAANIVRGKTYDEWKDAKALLEAEQQQLLEGEYTESVDFLQQTDDQLDELAEQKAKGTIKIVVAAGVLIIAFALVVAITRKK